MTYAETVWIQINLRPKIGDDCLQRAYQLARIDSHPPWSQFFLLQPRQQFRCDVPLTLDDVIGGLSRVEIGHRFNQRTF